MNRRWIILAALLGTVYQAGTAATSPERWSPADEERFLRTAAVVSESDAAKGLTKSQKVMLDDGEHRHAAHVQHIDVYLPLFKGKDGSEEKDFKDSWKFNVAAYRLARLLGLDAMVPVSVERTVDGKPASVTWWVDGVKMDERERYEHDISPPDKVRWGHQMDMIRIFDQLIYNMDRNRENLLITDDWTVWMIDHTRAFRKWPTLRNPAAITHCEPKLLRALRDLRERDVKRELGTYLTEEELDALMARRDAILRILENRLDAR